MARYTSSRQLTPATANGDDRGLQGRRRIIAAIVASVILITAAHYAVSPAHAIVHNFLQRLYYVPVVLAAYSLSRRSAVLTASVIGVLYAPHIFLTWSGHSAYQLSQGLEILLFIVVGYVSGWLFDRQEALQRIAESQTRMAQFGNLARSVIRALKAPLKSIQGLLVTVDAMLADDARTKGFVDLIRRDVESVSQLREDMIQLVQRRQARLSQHDLNEVAVSVASQIGPALQQQKITLLRSLSSGLHLSQINRKQIIDTMHQLIGNMIGDRHAAIQLTIYTGQSGRYTWLGATTTDIRLPHYYLSELSTLDQQDPGNPIMIHVINTMNSHFGEVKLRWDSENLIEFILVFPRQLKLPWYLRDERLRRPEPCTDNAREQRSPS